jgi:hypothetical protein
MDGIMGKTNWTAQLSDDLRLDVEIETENGDVQGFSFELCCDESGTWEQLARYDNAHGACHRHVMRPDGTEARKDFVAVLPRTFVGWVQDDLTDNAEKYRDEFRRQKGNLKNRGKR